jgi:hypothetical protein
MVKSRVSLMRSRLRTTLVLSRRLSSPPPASAAPLPRRPNRHPPRPRPARCRAPRRPALRQDLPPPVRHRPGHPSNSGKLCISSGAGTPPPPTLSSFAPLHRLRRGQPRRRWCGSHVPRKKREWLVGIRLARILTHRSDSVRSD